MNQLLQNYLCEHFVLIQLDEALQLTLISNLNEVEVITSTLLLKEIMEGGEANSYRTDK